MKRLNYALSFLAAIMMLSFSSLQAQYCDGPINGNDDEWITNVTFADVDHDTDQFVSTANTINATANVSPGEVISVSVGVTTNGTWTENIVVYFDLDNDFTFETSLDLGTMGTIANTEVTFDGGGANTVAMPTTPGTYRMRVVLDFGGPVPGPCDSDNASVFKDSEDYEIVVSGDGGGGGGDDDPVCYDLLIFSDDFGNETTWSLEDADGNELYSGGPFPDFTNNTESFCLDPGCYEFTIFDSFGDGICCSYGDGFYELVSEDGIVVAAGGDFDDEESTAFCTDCTPPSASASVVSYCAYGVFMVQVSVSDLGGASTLVIEDSEGNTLSNVFFPRTYYLGPYPIGTDVDIAIYDSENPACGVELTGLSDGCGITPNPGDAPEISTFSAFPNPTVGDVNVVVAEFMGKNANVEIYNAVGQLIESRELVDIQSATEQFDLSNQQAGVYVINVNVEGVGVFTERVMLSARP